MTSFNQLPLFEGVGATGPDLVEEYTADEFLRIYEALLKDGDHDGLDDLIKLLPTDVIDGYFDTELRKKVQ